MSLPLLAPPSRRDVDFDLAVVGAGIHGAGVAQAGAAAGYSVVVLEARAVAAGTSRRSSKLIHGGLRYLETGHWGLVREALREREILRRIAPALVRLVPFHIPVYRYTRRRPGTIRLGLALYALLGGLRRSTRFETIDRAAWSGLDGLRADGLEAVFRYHDAQTDDAALTRAVMNSAITLGATLHCPAQFMGARSHAESIEVEYESGGRRQTLRARALINAAGPWVDTVLARVSPHTEAPPSDLVQGTHVVLPGHLEHGAYYLEAPSDGRAVFATPWNGSVLVGTTETRLHGDPADARPSAQEIDYLRATAAHYFPRMTGEPQSSFAGVRVLPAGASGFARRARETRLFRDAIRSPRVLSIYGGKLTTYRATALRVLARLRPLLPTARRRANTATLGLPAAE